MSQSRNWHPVIWLEMQLESKFNFGNGTRVKFFFWKCKKTFIFVTQQPLSVFNLPIFWFHGWGLRYVHKWQKWQRKPFFLIYFPRPFIRQTHKLLIWKFILFCTTCFSHQALVTCCLQLMGFEPSPQQVKVVLVSNPKSYKKVKVWPQSNNRTPQKLGF